MKKVLFRPIENEKDKPPCPDTVLEEVEDSCQVCDVKCKILAPEMEAKRLSIFILKMWYQKLSKIVIKAFNKLM